MSALLAHSHKDKQAEETSKRLMLKNAVTTVVRQGSRLVKEFTRTDSQKSATAATSSTSSVEAKLEAEGDNYGRASR